MPTSAPARRRAGVALLAAAALLVTLAGCGDGPAATTSVTTDDGPAAEAAVTTVDEAAVTTAAVTAVSAGGPAEGTRVMVVEAPPLRDLENFERADRYVTAPLVLDTGTGIRACWTWGDSAPPSCDGMALLDVERADVEPVHDTELGWYTESESVWMVVEPVGDALRWLGPARPVDVTTLLGYEAAPDLPCRPADGWVDVDPAVVAEEQRSAAFRWLGGDGAGPVLASWQALPEPLGDFPPADDPTARDEWFRRADAHHEWVVVVRSSEPQRTADELAERWPGRVCVVGPVPGVDPVDGDPLAVVDEWLDGDWGGSRDNRSGRWELGTTFPAPELAAELDHRFGPGTVELFPSLVALDRAEAVGGGFLDQHP